MTSTLTSMLTDLGPVAVLVLMAVVFAETGLLVGFFLPGDSLLFAAGLLVASGALPVPLVVVIAATWVAAAAGDQVAYWIGGRLGGRLSGDRPSRWVSRKHVEAAHEFFRRHGHQAVILARFVPLARTFTPVVAGAVTMPRRRFTTYNVAGGLLWTTTLCVAGHFLGAVPVIADHVDVVAIGMVGLSLVPAALAVLRSRQQARTEPASDPASDSGSTLEERTYA